MMRIGLFLGTNLAIIALISLTFRLLGFEGLLQANGVDLNLTALLVYSAVIGFAGSLISLFLSKSMTKASMGVTIIDQPRTKRALDHGNRELADRAGIAMPEVGIFDHPPRTPSPRVGTRTRRLRGEHGSSRYGTRRGRSRFGSRSQSCRQRRYGHLGAYPGCREYLVIFLSRVVGFGRPIGLRAATRPRTSLWIVSMIAEFVFGILATTIVMWFSAGANTGRRRRRGTRRPAKHDQCLETPSRSRGQTRPYRTKWQRLRLTRGGCKPSSRAIRHWRSGLKPSAERPLIFLLDRIAQRMHEPVRPSRECGR